MTDSSSAETVDRPAMRVLALLVTIGFFATIYILLVHGKPASGGDALLVLVGALGTAWTGVMGFYFRNALGAGSKA